MKNQKKTDYFLGLDIGTDSVGYAVTDTEYNLCKFQQHPMWGSHLFEAATTAAERRAFRVARRRLDRRQQRVDLLQELFAKEIAKVDPNFFIRIEGSALQRDETEEKWSVFSDSGYTDKEYHRQYPTIHHLICELIDSSAPHDVRLVYLACAWLIVHRGHFLSQISKEDGNACDFVQAFANLDAFMENNSYVYPWNIANAAEKIGEALKRNRGIKRKLEALKALLFPEGKPPKVEITEDSSFPYDVDAFLNLICGGVVPLKKLLADDSCEDLKICLADDDEKIQETLANLSDEVGTMILCLKEIYDCSVLADILGSSKNISQAKVRLYEQHGKDLKTLKSFIRKYVLGKYNDVFRKATGDNYVSYSKNAKSVSFSSSKDVKFTDQEAFLKFLKGVFDKIKPNASDEVMFNDMMARIADGSFMPKQVSGNNRTIPFQLHYKELKCVLKNAETYLPFLREKDADGLSVADKVLSLVEFRIPYFVGPLNRHSDFSWFERKAEGRILPWNIEKMVDYDASEQKFIDKMVNKCTYLPGETVLPKKSLLYEKFEVLNIINNICVDGKPITVESKQRLFKELFLDAKKGKRVTKKKIADFFKSNNIYPGVTVDGITGVDDVITSSLASHIAFKDLLERKLNNDEIENIISWGTYCQDKDRFKHFLTKNYPKLTEQDIKYVVRQGYADFGRLSKAFLTGIYHADANGLQHNIISMMWEQNLCLQELLSQDFTFRKQVESARENYYREHPETLNERLNDMYVSNAVKRPIIRALTIVREVVQTMGCPPKKIFVEMARDASNEKKGKRTQSRYEQLKELYKKIKDEDVKEVSAELDAMGAEADGKLQSRALFLYFMQLGRCMYTGEPIHICDLKTNKYNIDHIYPQSKVKDDSILENLVLVKSETNGHKSDSYPIEPEIQRRQDAFWRRLKKNGLITDEKYFRLTRTTPFSEDEEWGFINRQLVETRQSTKVMTELLNGMFKGKSTVVYVKAGLVSDFRKEYEMLKSRAVNDLHHAKDAFLNIVVGNVYNEMFTKNYFNPVRDKYNVRTEKIFGKPLTRAGSIVWTGENSIAAVKNTMRKNYVHLTNYSFCVHGGLFDQLPVKAQQNLVPLKKGYDPAVYGGYNKTKAAFFALVKTQNKKNSDLTFVPVELMVCKDFLDSEAFAVEYVKRTLQEKERQNTVVSFPLGLRPFKINTVIEVNNSYRFCIVGKTGSSIVAKPFTPLILPIELELYVKRLESLSEKMKENKNYKISTWDKITAEENLQLFDALCEKMHSKPFSYRAAVPPQDKMHRDVFTGLSLDNQMKVLLQVVKMFQANGRGGVDLTLLGESGQTAKSTLSGKVSTWGKSFDSVHIVSSDASGLHEVKSKNLLDLIDGKKTGKVKKD